MRSMGADGDDRTILDYLLARHPAMVALDEVVALEGVEHAREAVARLRDDGLVTQLGGLIGTTRTFRRARALVGRQAPGPG
jgi:hypothetical protein